MENEFATREKGVQGFKRGDFTDDKEKVFGEGIRPELPEGVRLYLREKSIDLSTKTISVNVYRLVDDGGIKNRRLWVGKWGNRLPEDGEIAQRFGGGSFIWIAKWKNPDGAEAGLMSEQIDIDPELGERARLEAEGKGKAAASGPATAAPPHSVPEQLTVAGVLQLMAAAEEKSLTMFERIARVMSGQRQETPAEVLNGAYRGASEMMQKAFETNLRMVDDHRKVAGKMLTMDPPKIDPEPEELDDQDPTPAWLRPFIDAAAPYLEKLLAGGPLGAAVKTLILSDQQWNEIISDPERWAEAVGALERNFGSEKTRKAIEILRPSRSSKPQAKKGRK